MAGASMKNAVVAGYELEIEIDASPQRVWEAIVDETDAWWLPDFHMVGEGSRLTFDARAGGGLVETLPGGGSLLWFTVQWIRPDTRTLYLFGHIAPDWGGPSCSHLKLAVAERGDGSVLQVTDAHHGHVDEANLKNLRDGWAQLFGDGLKRFVEA